jgi:pimeloyl-ACP methyl ester carboxylesterase
VTGVAGEPPGWFRRATGTPFETRTLAVEGASINLLVWGEAGRPGLLFVHGGGAHAHWWSFLVALLTDDYRVAALDLSGHGDSSWRERYRLTTWAAEVAAAARAMEAAGPPIVVGHSMGGFVTATAAALHPDDIGGAIILDSPIQRPDPEVEAGNQANFAKAKVHPDRDLAVARFRTVPPQDHYVPYVLRHVAEHSLKPVDGGWTWKFDPTFMLPDRADPAGLLPRIRCRVALFRSEHGLVTPDVGAYMYEQLGRRAPVIEVPEAGHHLMLDQPLSLLTGLRTLLADGEHSRPVRRD